MILTISCFSFHKKKSQNVRNKLKTHSLEPTIYNFLKINPIWKHRSSAN